MIQEVRRVFLSCSVRAISLFGVCPTLTHCEPPTPLGGTYPLARNQYINNSPGIFSCIRAGADTCAACICTEINSPKYFYVLAPGMCEYRHYINTEGRGQSANTYFKNNSSKIFSCIRTHANTGPTCIRAKINSSRFFSCMYRFCAGGYGAICSLLVSHP